jgi:hypothetical protein
VRFSVELSSDDDGRISGEVTSADGRADSFTGWLELMSHLERGAERETGAGDPPPGGTQ